MSIRALLITIGIILIVLGCWVNWEAVVKPLKSMTPGAWDKGFPSPFYLWYAPIWVWHDLSYTLIIIGTIILGYYSIKPYRYRGNKDEHILS